MYSGFIFLRPCSIILLDKKNWKVSHYATLKKLICKTSVNCKIWFYCYWSPSQNLKESKINSLYLLLLNDFECNQPISSDSKVFVLLLKANSLSPELGSSPIFQNWCPNWCEAPMMSLNRVVNKSSGKPVNRYVQNRNSFELVDLPLGWLFLIQFPWKANSYLASSQAQQYSRSSGIESSSSSKFSHKVLVK